MPGALSTTTTSASSYTTAIGTVGSGSGNAAALGAPVQASALPASSRALRATTRPSTVTASRSTSARTSLRDHPVSSASARSTRSPASVSGTTTGDVTPPDPAVLTTAPRAGPRPSRGRHRGPRSGSGLRKLSRIRRIAPIVMAESATLNDGNQPTFTKSTT